MKKLKFLTMLRETDGFLLEAFERRKISKVAEGERKRGYKLNYAG